jgi:glycosyltransferase involved in cell wall biosynthesis
MDSKGITASNQKCQLKPSTIGDEMPKFDIIIPAYNAASFLSAALQSVIEQTYPDWRILLVNDGSTDDTKKICTEFQRRLGPKMLLIDQENRGLSASRNVAIRASSAPFLALLDADDVWLPNRLEESLRCFDDERVGMAYGFVSLIDADGKVLRTQNPEEQQDSGTMAKAIYTRSVNLPCPTISFRRRCIEELGCFDESMRACEDRDLWLRIALQYQVARIGKVIASYRLSAGSMSTDIDRMSVAQQKFIEKHRESKEFSGKDQRIAISSVYRQRAESFGERGMLWKSFANGLRSFVIAPNLTTAKATILALMRLPLLLKKRA